MKYLQILTLFLILTRDALAITTRNNPVRRHTSALPLNDWELGLREAVHQALLREHYTEPSLRDQLLEAPLIGRHDNASPFGDIAVLARGQLYITQTGFKFVQDSDQIWDNLEGGDYKLLALWTVKRIRHRDPQYGHIFEIEYTISPITPAINEDLIRRHGYFNYNIPGHIFIIKSDPRVNYVNNDNSGSAKWFQTQQQNVQHYGFKENHFKPGILIGVSPDGYKHVLHSVPGFFSSYHPQNDQTTVDPKEYELYKKLIESLASKTTHKTPHRFAVTTPKQQTTIDTTQPTYRQLTTLIPIPKTTYIQLVPLSESRLDITTVPPKPITTVHYYAPVEEPETTQIQTTSTVTPVKSRTSGKKYMAKTRKPTTPVVEEMEEEAVYPLVTSTEPMKTVTEIPTRPDLIKGQLPAPEQNTEITSPYVTSTVTEATTVSKSETTTMVITKIPTEIQRVPDESVTVFHSSNPPTLFTEMETTSRTEGKRITIPVTTSLEPVKTTEAFVLVERIPSTQFITTTTKTKPKPTTIVDYSFEATTKPYTDTTINSETQSTVYFSTNKLTNPPISTRHTTFPTTSFHTNPPTSTLHTKFPTTSFHTNPPTSTLHTKFPTTSFHTNTPTTTIYTNPPSTTTTHYFYTFDEEQSKTIDSTSTTHLTQTETITIPSTTRQLKTTTEKSTKSTDFFSDINESKTVQSILDKKKDFDNDDIFGKPPPKSSTEPIETTTKRIFVESDIGQELFSGKRRSKQLKISSKISSTPKIIYTNFYSPSTQNPTKTTFYQTTPQYDGTTEFRPLTDQSFSTSISFKVNKRVNQTTKENLNNDRKNEVNTTTNKDMMETKKAFDNLALQLVNHARSIDYLNKKPTKQPKSKRRSYLPKGRRIRKQQ